jgi:carboxyl-terminal processing protease
VERSYDGKKENLKLRRRRISVPSVPYAGIIRDGVGYIAHNDFIQGSYIEVRKALEQMISEGELRGLVLDYRSNGGGLMREAVDIASLFVDHGELIVSIRGRDSLAERQFKTEHNPIARDIPIVILVNGASASASEILAGSLQDMDRAVVMGQRTYGKGLVQSTAYVGYNAYLKYTTEKYYIPSGRCIQAHDYASRNSDGTIAKVPDSLITAYTTRGGRNVYDGGGIVPDVKLEPKYSSRFAATIYGLGYIDTWCDEYMRRHRDDKVDVRTFKLSDEEYNNFVEWIKDKEVEYESESRRALKALEKALENDLYDEELRDEVKHLGELIKDDKLSNMQTYRSDIEKMLTVEILSRYSYTRGAVEYYAVTDEDVDKAIDLILNSEEYERILREQHLSMH